MLSRIMLIFLFFCATSHASCESKTTFVPLQVTYDPVFEQALNYYKQRDYGDSQNFFAANFFVQTTTAPLSKYFMINNRECLNVQEDGFADVDSLWFQVISSDPTFYSSRLRMKPQRVQVGGIFTGSFNLSFIREHLRLAFNTALVYAQTRVNLCESCQENPGTVPGFISVTESFASPERSYAKICPQTQRKTGLDDIQLKLIYDVQRAYGAVSPYFLFGVPTGSGTKARYLFEPLVGSKHVNLGLGTTFDCQFPGVSAWVFALLGEIKWRYACAAHETRSLDMVPNGQWSRYLLVTSEADRYTPFFASNVLAFRVRAVPRNNVNLWLALHAQYREFNLEAGYGFNYRQQEKITVMYPGAACLGARDIGIADLPGIAALNPESASTATISQAVEPGINEMHSDSMFTPITIFNINPCSGAQPQTITNKVYLSLGHTTEFYRNRPSELTLSLSYEQGNTSALSQFALWFGGNILF